MQGLRDAQGLRTSDLGRSSPPVPSSQGHEFVARNAADARVGWSAGRRAAASLAESQLERKIPAGLESASIRVTTWDEAGSRLAERIVRLGGRGVERIGAPPVLDLDPASVRFGRQPFGSHSEQAFSIENRSAQGVWVTVEQLDVPDDFSPGQPGSTCPLGSASGPTWLGPGESCTHGIGFDPIAFFAGLETARMIVTAHDAAGTLLFSRIVKLSGTGVPAP